MKMRKLFIAVILSIFLPSAWAARIVTLTPDVADIVVALGHGHEVVGRDVATKNPALAKVPAIGLFHGLSVEPIVAKKPSIVMGSWMAQPQNIYAKLNQLGVKAVNVAPQDDIKHYPASIIQVGNLLDQTTQAKALAEQWQKRIRPMPANGKRYLITYDGRYVAGRGTAADELIRRAGGVNAAGNIEGMKPLTREAWLMAKPDIILMADRNAGIVGGAAGLAKRPEIAVSAAAKQQRIYVWPANDMFRYGLNTPEIIQRLADLAK
ncbi:ABC transporter substrate-binding protein [Neisseriaceae bacterium ESL0693]|nr:ABC transporter substrate-binding protein [Neisseriaceae bacterium ESL0693]